MRVESQLCICPSYPTLQNKEFQDALKPHTVHPPVCFPDGESGYGKVYLSPVYLTNIPRRNTLCWLLRELPPSMRGEARCTVSSNCRFILCCPMTPISAYNGDASTNSLNTPNLTASCSKNWSWLSSTRFPWYGQISSMPSTVFCGFTHATSGSLSAENNPAGGRCVPVGTRRQRR